MSALLHESVQDCDPVPYLVVGHVTHDVWPDKHITAGGTASYASLTAAALHGSAGILTCAGPDFDVTTFDGKVRLVVRPAAATTTFENIYVGGNRRQIVHTVADQLTAADVPATWQNSSIVHIGPVLAECDLSLVDRFARTSFLGLTLQGWLRARGSDHSVTYQEWEAAELFLARASVAVLSIEDLLGDWALAERFARAARLLVVTTGAQGGVLYVDGSHREFPAFPVTEIDPTGAGDIFAASLFTALAKGTAPMPAARFAACLASPSVTRVGLASVPRAEEVERCSVWLRSRE